MKPNPFTTLECVKEHIDSAFLELGKTEGKTPREFRGQDFPLGTPGYHLLAAEEAVCRLYQQLAVALPLARDLDEGEVSGSILDAIDDAG